jgi:hypothetical protein
MMMRMSPRKDRFQIPDSDLLFPGVKAARGLAGRGGWRKAFAWVWLLALLAIVGLVITAIVRSM